MAGFVDTTIKDIDTRLGELREEAAKLEAARSALLGPRRGGRRPGAPEPRRRPGRPPGRRSGNTRANQALELVRSRSGITIPQIAEELGIEPNYLYRVMPRLVSDGQVIREGQGWRPVTTGVGDGA